MRSIRALTAVLLVFIIALPFTVFAAEKGSAEVSEVTSETDVTSTAETTEAAAETEPTTEAAKPAPKLNGFKKLNGKRVYYINGKLQKGYVRIKGSYYYFNSKGYMVTGLRKIKGHTLFFSKSGKMFTGFKKLGKHRCYFRKNGWMAKGVTQIGKYKYLFSSKGYMLKGSRKLGNNYYYFDKNGRMKTGLLRKGGKTYYYSKSTGKRVTGYRTIGGHTYYFKKKGGAAMTGFATIKQKKKSYSVYFDKQGRLKKGTFTVGRVEYKTKKKTGEIYSYRNLATALCQYPEMPSGCEVVSWTMMANFAGVKITKTKTAAVMPKSRNPNKGFMGSPYMVTGDGLVVYPNGLKSITTKYLHGFRNLTGCTLTAIKEQLRHKKLVMVWAKGLNFDWSHTVALTGYDSTGFYYNDPSSGQKAKMSYKTFSKVWKANGTMAMTY